MFLIAKPRNSHIREISKYSFLSYNLFIYNVSIYITFRNRVGFTFLHKFAGLVCSNLEKCWPPIFINASLYLANSCSFYKFYLVSYVGWDTKNHSFAVLNSLTSSCSSLFTALRLFINHTDSVIIIHGNELHSLVLWYSRTNNL